jgi:Glycosyltransferase family 87
MMLASEVAPESPSPRPRKFWPHDLILGLLPLLLGFEVLLWTVYLPLGTRGIADFRQFYTGGYMLRMGQAKRLYDYDKAVSLEETLVPVGQDTHFLLSITHPAFEYLLFVPSSLFSYRAAYWIFMVFNFALLALSLWLLRPPLDALFDRWKWFPALLFAAFYPISRTLTQGQDSIIMLALLAGSLVALDRGEELTAGLLVGIGVFKFQVALPIALLFVLWRRWRFSLGFGISSCIAALVSLCIVGFGGARAYLGILFSMSARLSSRTDIFRDPMTPNEMLNLRGLISAIFTRHLSPFGLQCLIFVACVATLVLAARQRPSLPLAITASSLVSYHFIAHDATILILPVAVALCATSVWVAVLAFLVLIAPIFAIVPAYGYLAAIPLLVFFLATLGRMSQRNEFTEVRQEVIAGGSPCR